MTNIHTILELVKADAEAVAIAIETPIHEAVGKLKDWYTRVYGALNADIHDWHWIATTVKNSAAIESAPVGEQSADTEIHAGNASADTKTDASPGASEPSTPDTKAAEPVEHHPV